MAEKVWFIRLFVGVKHGFPYRWHEWVMALGEFLWSGNWLFDNADNFLNAEGNVSPAWRGLQYLFGADWVFAGGMFILALARLTALAINGTFYETWYARWSPLVRAATAGLCGVAWFAIWISSAAAKGQGGVTFWILVAIDFFTAFFVINEGADALRDWWRNGRTGRNS